MKKINALEERRCVIGLLDDTSSGSHDAIADQLISKTNKNDWKAVLEGQLRSGDHRYFYFISFSITFLLVLYNRLAPVISGEANEKTKKTRAIRLYL